MSKTMKADFLGIAMMMSSVPMFAQGTLALPPEPATLTGSPSPPDSPWPSPRASALSARAKPYRVPAKALAQSGRVPRDPLRADLRPGAD